MTTWDINGLETPYKLGRPVLAGSGEAGAFDEQAVDCPFVFRHRDRFYMMYVGYNGIGYQTALATSDNLLDWTHLAVIMKRGEGNGWDSHNAAGCWLLRNNELNGPPTLKKWNNRYWMAYHAYPGDGFEAGPGRIGLAWTEDDSLLSWNRLPDPILSPEDGADWEHGGLYKECLVEHEGRLCLFYNAKNNEKDGRKWIEQTGMAVSSDMTDWERHPGNPVLRVSPDRWDSRFASDPCVLRDGDRWAMFYFDFDGKHAQDGVAVSPDLTAWTKYSEPVVAAGREGELDSIHAHKPSLIWHDGTLYHFYVAVRPYREGDATAIFGREFRTIAVATSRPIPAEGPDQGGPRG